MNEKMNYATINYLQKVSSAVKQHNEILKERIKVSLGKLPIWYERSRKLLYRVIIPVLFIFVSFQFAGKIPLNFVWLLLALVVLWGVVAAILVVKIDNIKRKEFVKYADKDSEYLRMIEFLRQVEGKTSEFGYGFYKYL
jgi:hypothetical protein